MNLSKSYEFFQPEMCRDRIHIIGCGSVGSVVAENLVRFGLTNITLYDFDVVEAKNIANQMFTQRDIGLPKVEALSRMLAEINPDIEKSLKIESEGYTTQKLSGYVFLCVDNIDLRREIATNCRDNPFIKAFFDFRTRLTDAQHYAANWKDKKMVEDFIETMAFTHEEAMEATPVSACNTVLSVAPTIRAIVAYGVSNFINFVKDGTIKKLILSDAFDHSVVAM